MNKQDKGNGRRGIEWTDYTWNPVRGCLHDCQWTMPDGALAECYAKTTAENIARTAYPKGFEHHYWMPSALDEPLKLKKPARIFLDSMSDLMGHWVPDEQIVAVLNTCRRAQQHTFQLLTKNAPRLLKFNPFPTNVWVGVSLPPSYFMGKELSPYQRDCFLETALRVLGKVQATVRFMSFEPLSWNVGESIYNYLYLPLEWAIIGAASSGREHHQPKSRHIERLLEAMEERHIPVFMKGNLDWKPHREEFPIVSEKGKST